VFHKANLVLKKVFPKACSIDQVSQEDSSWPMLLILQTNELVFGSHAITLWKGMIFDSNSLNALRWSQRSLDWCSGKGSKCVGFSKVYRLCPNGFGQSLKDSTIRVGTQVRSCLKDSNCLGWVRLLPTLKENGEQKKGYIVSFTDGTKAEWGQSRVLAYQLTE
jgi:hypothetical protein